MTMKQIVATTLSAARQSLRALSAQSPRRYKRVWALTRSLKPWALGRVRCSVKATVSLVIA